MNEKNLYDDKHKTAGMIYDIEMISESEGRQAAANALVGTALDQVNAIRIALAIGEGKIPALPQGVPGNADHCVIAKALSNGWKAYVDNNSIELIHSIDSTIEKAKIRNALAESGFIILAMYSDDNEIYIVIKTTTALDLMIRAFDEQLLPELILE